MRELSPKVTEGEKRLFIREGAVSRRLTEGEM